MAQDMTYVHGNLEGVFRAWYEDGARQSEHAYRAGKIDGLARGWHPNGMRAFESRWRDGVLVGEKRWDAQGRPERVTK